MEAEAELTPDVSGKDREGNLGPGDSGGDWEDNLGPGVSGRDWEASAGPGVSGKDREDSPGPGALPCSCHGRGQSASPISQSRRVRPREGRQVFLGTGLVSRELENHLRSPRQPGKDHPSRGRAFPLCLATHSSQTLTVACSFWPQILLADQEGVQLVGQV